MPACLLGMALLTGCASTSRQKWNSRAGSYSVQQAVTDLGRPQKAARLSDGSQVGTWMTRLGTRGALNYGLVRVYNTHTVDYNFWNNAPYIPDEYLRLLFGPDGKLITWDRQYK